MTELPELPPLPAKPEYVGWQFRYVFEDQGNRRCEWSGVLEGEPSYTSGYRSYNGWKYRFYHEVRRVYAAAVEPYVEDPHHKPPAYLSPDACIQFATATAAATGGTDASR